MILNMAFDQYRKGPNIFLIIVYLIFGVYFIDQPFQFIKLPEAISSFEPWIIFVGRILILIGAVNYFRANRRLY